MHSCTFHDTMATHELALVDEGRTYSSPDDVDWTPICESCADDYPSTHVRPITHFECCLCGRGIDREHPEVPLCAGCEKAGRAHGKREAERRRFEREYGHAS